MNIEAWRYYGGFYRRHRLQLLLTAVVSIVQALLQLPIVLLVRYAFDRVIPARDFRLLALLGLVILVLHLVSGGLTLYTRRAVLRITKLAIQRLREQILGKLYAVSRSYYSQADHGKLHTAAVQDTERLDVMSNALIALLIPAVLTSASLSILLVLLDWRLFLVLIAVMPPLVIASRATRRLVRREVQKFHRSFAAFSKGIAFVLEAMDLTRIQSAEQWETRRQKENLEDLRVTSGRMSWLMTAHSQLQEMIMAASGVLILIVGGWSVAMGHTTLGGLFSFSAAVALLRSHLHALFFSLPAVIEGNESLTTLYELLQTKEAEPYSGSRRIDFQGKITLSGVKFGYREQPILQGVDLTIEPGSTVALLGSNGVGKSTIAYLILGFYRPQEGALHADDVAYDALDIADLRRQIGVVTQDPIIFPGTVWENVTYGCPEASPDQVRRVLQLTMADEFVERLPAGWDTSVGERGTLLAGGQRQRLALARALLRQPRLLILDEPTNHLDEAAIHRLMDHLNALDNRPAKLIISHDRSIVRQADHVYVLQQGRIATDGAVW